MPQFEQQQGEHILYEHSAELRACAGNVGFLDTAILSFEATLGVEAPSPLRYSWLSEADIPSWRYKHEGDALLGGEAIGLRAWARTPAKVHELAHLVAGGDNAAPFFQEGLAVALDETTGPRGLRYLQSAPPDPRPYMTVSAPRDLDYLLAGVFVNFLLARHGPVKFMKFYRSLVWPFTLKRIQATFAEAFGVEMDAEVDVFRSGSPIPCEELAFSPPPIECTGMNVPWSEERAWNVVADMDCDSPGVVGGDDATGVQFRWLDYTLDVSLPGMYRLGMDAPGRDRLRFGPCFSCPESVPETELVGQETTEVQLAPGTYYIRVLAGSDDSRVRVNLEMLDDTDHSG